jgi:hypothetical protein
METQIIEQILVECRKIALQLANANEQETKTLIERLHNYDNAIYWYKRAQA